MVVKIFIALPWIHGAKHFKHLAASFDVFGNANKTFFESNNSIKFPNAAWFTGTKGEKAWQ